MESEPTQKKKEHSSKMKNKMLDEEEISLGDNLEQLLWEINEFCSPNNAKKEEIPPALENYLKYVAKTGNTVFPWQHVQPLFRSKMLAAINNFAGEICSNEKDVLERFDGFRAAPFTIQRLAELITQPNRHYKIKEKFLRGLEKTVLVVTTVEPKSLNAEEEEETLGEEPMSWLSHSDGEGLSDSAEPIIKTESDLHNLNQLIATVHPAPAVEPAVSLKIDVPPVVLEPQEESPKEEEKPSVLDHQEEGITDTTMPLNIASPSLEYNVDIIPATTISAPESSSFTLEPSLTPVEQPSTTSELVPDLKSELPAEEKEPVSEPVLKATESSASIPESPADLPMPEPCEESSPSTEETPMEQADFAQDSDTKESSSTDSSCGESSSASDEAPTLASIAPTDPEPKPDNVDIPMEADVESIVEPEKAEESVIADAVSTPELAEPPEVTDTTPR